MHSEDLRALTSLNYSHVTLYGKFRLDMNERLVIETAVAEIDSYFCGRVTALLGLGLFGHVISESTRHQFGRPFPVARLPPVSAGTGLGQHVDELSSDRGG